MIAYCDRDWVGCIDDTRSTSGYASSLGSGLFSWMSKKQERVALSSVEAEYVSALMATSHALWLRRILEDLDEGHGEAISIFCDNKSTIAMTKNPINHSHTKHIAIKQNFIREVVKNGEVQILYCKMEEQVADIFTKALPKGKFQLLREIWDVMKKTLKGEC